VFAAEGGDFPEICEADVCAVNGEEVGVYAGVCEEV